MWSEQREQPRIILHDQQMYSEIDIFPDGLPDADDLLQKKKKREEERLLFEDVKNPPSTPIELQT